MNDKEIAAVEELGQVPEVRQVMGRAAVTFERKVDIHCELKETEAQAHDERKKIDEWIANQLADVKAVLLPDLRKVQVIERSGNRSLDQEKLKDALLRRGVPATVIAECLEESYKIGKPWRAVMVTNGKTR